MDYKILIADDKAEMEELVKSYLDSGWETQGGISAAVYMRKIAGDSLIRAADVQTFRYFQAMIKKSAPQI